MVERTFPYEGMKTVDVEYYRNSEIDIHNSYDYLQLCV